MKVCVTEMYWTRDVLSMILYCYLKSKDLLKRSYEGKILKDNAFLNKYQIGKALIADKFFVSKISNEQNNPKKLWYKELDISKWVPQSNDWKRSEKKNSSNNNRKYLGHIFCWYATVLNWVKVRLCVSDI